MALTKYTKHLRVSARFNSINTFFNYTFTSDHNKQYFYVPLIPHMGELITQADITYYNI